MRTEKARGSNAPHRRVFNFKYTPKQRRIKHLRKHYKRNPVSGTTLRWAVLQCYKASLNAKETAGVLSIPVDEASSRLALVRLG